MMRLGQPAQLLLCQPLPLRIEWMRRQGEWRLR